MFGAPTSQSIPRNWVECHEWFEGRRHKDRDYRKLGAGNTTVWHRGYQNDKPIYGIQLHSTDIITYYPDGAYDLDSYDSHLTNSRRDDAGAPVIRSARAMGVPKPYLLDCDRRWDLRGANQLYPYGVPARDLKFNSTDVLTHIDGVPAAEYKELVRVPDKEAQKLRRRVLRRTRALLKPWCTATEQLGDEVGEWGFDLMDLEMWLEAIDKGEFDSDEAAAGAFIEKFWSTSKYSWRNQTPAFALDAELNKLQPSHDRTDRMLWDTVEVHPSDLPKYLG